MVYTYRNKRTKAVINTSNKVTGKNWELVEDADPEQNSGEGFEEDTFEEDTIEDDPVKEEINQTEVAEKAPAAKPKASRRGKK